MSRIQISAMFQAFLAAALFGASAPIAKLLLEDIEPVLLAGLLYLGSGMGAVLLRGFQTWSTKQNQSMTEARLKFEDLPWLGGALLCGSVAAPIILFYSLRVTPAATIALLLNFEGVATTLIAALIFREAIGGWVWASIGVITVAGSFLSWDASGNWGFSGGAIGVMATCVLWGLDNNFTRNVSAKNPLDIVAIKGLGAGGISLTLAVILGSPMPRWPVVGLTMLLGSLSYGLSIMLFILALRNLGTARTSAIFSSAPFIGALFSLAIFQETPTLTFIVAFVLMGVGASLLLGEQHRHVHAHPVATHEHRHRHDDDHHNHVLAGHQSQEDHSHPHLHERLVHMHAHVPDIHHWHNHQE